MKIKERIKLVTMLVLMLPIFIKAETYYETINKVNNEIFNYQSYNDYIYLDNNTPYKYENKENIVDPKFKNGGLLSKDEYLITNYKNNSYLATGIEFWTISQYDANKQYTIDISLSNKNINANSNTRMTQYVQNDAEVTGAGTRDNPWVFKDIFSVTLTTTNKHRGLLSLNECLPESKKEKIIVKKFTDTKAYFYMCPEFGFEYNAEKSSCRSFITSESGNKYELSDTNDNKLIDNMICTIDFAYQTTAMTLVDFGENTKAVPAVPYLAKNGHSWFSDSKGYTAINKITIPYKKGYIFGGYYSGYDNNAKTVTGARIIDENGNFTTTDFDGNTLYPKWTPIEYDVAFDTNGGNNSLSKIHCIYDQPCNLPKATGILTRNNHTFWGWTKERKSPQGGNPTVNFKDQVNAGNLTDQNDTTVTLFAMWRIDYYCNSGATLTEDSSKGWICIYNSSAYQEGYSCNYECCSSGTCFTNQPTSCGSKWSWECGGVCWAGGGCYISIPYSCTSCSTCTKTCYRTRYTCGSGSIYSGNYTQSTMKCYYNALSS